MRNRVMRRRMHRVLWKKLSRIYAVDMAEVLGWIEYISITGIFQCFCIVCFFLSVPWQFSFTHSCAPYRQLCFD